jgi:hypothetical protein
MMNLEAIAAVIVVGWSGTLTMTGCAAGPANEEPSPEYRPLSSEHELSAPSSTLKSDRQGRDYRFSCSKLGCICHGDHDCNTMFESGVCGDVPAKCFERGPGPHYCICARWIGSSGAGDRAAPGRAPAHEP